MINSLVSGAAGAESHASTTQQHGEQLRGGQPRPRPHPPSKVSASLKAASSSDFRILSTYTFLYKLLFSHLPKIT